MHKFAALRRVFHGAKPDTRGDSLLLLRPPCPAAPLSEPFKARPPDPKARRRLNNNAGNSQPFTNGTPGAPPGHCTKDAAEHPADNSSGAPTGSTGRSSSAAPTGGPNGQEAGGVARDCSGHQSATQAPAPEMKYTYRFKSKPRADDFQLLKTIGTGSFGRVFIAKLRSDICPDGPPYAIKRLTKSAVVKQKQMEHVLSEREILARVEHPLIVRLHATFQDRAFLYIVMEYVGGGEFFSFLRRAKRLDNDAARFYAAHITLIYEYLHPLSIVYRDLKPENLLLTWSGYLKLTDFGFAKVVESRTYTLCGTPEYIAPEVLLNKGHGKPVDWWTLGILIYEMLVGYPPFFDEDAIGIYQKILAGKIVFPRFLSRDAKSLIKHLLTHDVVRRYGVIKDGTSDVRNHRWFEDFDFAALLRREIKPPSQPARGPQGQEDTSNFGNYEEATADSKGAEESFDNSIFKDCVGHRGKFGHEFLEFEFRADGRMRYANNSNYKNDTMIRKEAYVTPAVLETLHKIIKDSEIIKEQDDNWPASDRVGRQELEIILNGKHHQFVTSKIGALADVTTSEDPEGLRVFYYLVQDLKCLVFSLISLHFRIKPV